MARVIHGEARGESYLGKLAVGAVVVNRLNSPLFPDTLYEVIYEPWAFTCVQDGQINLEPDEESYRAAMDALNGIDPTNGCLFYYNPKPQRQMDVQTAYRLYRNHRQSCLYEII